MILTNQSNRKAITNEEIRYKNTNINREYRQIKESILKNIDEHNNVLNKSRELADKITNTILLIKESYGNGGKLIFIGNGGSAADSQHIATEFIGILKLPAIALTTNSSILTSIANDFGYENVFSKQIEILGNDKDILIAISTSGNSSNILKAAEVAKSKNIKVIGLTGKSGGKLKDLTDILINVNSENTQRIQEIHEIIYHIIFEVIRNLMLDNNSRGIN